MINYFFKGIGLMGYMIIIFLLRLFSLRRINKLVFKKNLFYCFMQIDFMF